MTFFGLSVRGLLIAGLLLAIAPSPASATRKAHTTSTSRKKVSTSTSSHASVKRTSRTTASTSKSRRGASASLRAKGKSSKGKQVVRSRGQQGIAPERAREIQEALIKANYLNGEPSGVWDAQTQAALTRFQGDNGWQTKIVPDSRALIKLGLGPSHSNVLNPAVPAAGDSPAAVSNSAAQLQPGGATSN